MQVRKQQLELDMDQQTGSKSGKEYIKAVYCHPAYYLYAEYIMWNAGLDEAQAGINITEKNIHNLRYADDTTLMAESEEELKKIYFCFTDYTKAFDYVDHSVENSCPSLCGKFLKRWEYQTALPASWEICKRQLELDMKQWSDSKLGKEYVKAVYCHPAYLTYIQSRSWEMLGWMKHKLESRLPGEISVTSDM